jgi:hypothetical protein
MKKIIQTPQRTFAAPCITRAARLVARIEIVLTLLLLLASFVYVEVYPDYLDLLVKRTFSIEVYL